MNVASLELCKQLWELSGWSETFSYWEYSDSIPLGEPYLTQPELMRRYGLWSTQEVKKRFPAYDLGFLLRKLQGCGEMLFQPKAGKWQLINGKSDIENLYYADTPEDATAMLAIALFQQSILKRKGEE